MAKIGVIQRAIDYEGYCNLHEKASQNSFIKPAVKKRAEENMKGKNKRKATAPRLVKTVTDKKKCKTIIGPKRRKEHFKNVLLKRCSSNL